MIQELEMHEQEDGSFISEPAPCGGVFIGVLHGEDGKLLWSFAPDRPLNTHDVIVVGRLRVLADLLVRRRR